MKQGRVLALLLALVGSVGGCAGTPANFAIWGPQTRPQPGARLPAPVNPASGQPTQGSVVWTPGYWRWENNQQRWVDGQWQPNRPNERWVGDRWVPEGSGQWKLENGYWRRE